MLNIYLWKYYLLKLEYQVNGNIEEEEAEDIANMVLPEKQKVDDIQGNKRSAEQKLSKVKKRRGDSRQSTEKVKKPTQKTRNDRAIVLHNENSANQVIIYTMLN